MATKNTTRKKKDNTTSEVVGAGVGVAGGAAAGAAAGAAIGSAVMPGAGTAVGGAIGAVVGAVGGGFAGKAVADYVDPREEEAYWRKEYLSRPYYREETKYEQIK